jgi:hypothetical protein
MNESKVKKTGNESLSSLSAKRNQTSGTQLEKSPTVVVNSAAGVARFILVQRTKRGKIEPKYTKGHIIY